MSRDYQVHLSQNLLGNWALSNVWGGLGVSSRAMHNTGVDYHEDGAEQIRETARRRTQHK